MSISRGVSLSSCFSRVGNNQSRQVMNLFLFSIVPITKGKVGWLREKKNSPLPNPVLHVHLT
ncbi:hypothetical protein M419DRAFT_123638 [Trichoderma reesei RUT C-30]|uniref:Uncharacterized protein n=1 Tax=Hypocrea jecorina (strain ATCC 56765 / BCRC 32924 / NRRL 11460 / Rut C-30) TaxID=1344414 RepID=A0A024S9D7_HYPJR|nr:hypothetical protein M419DRAFT_123638 [Trichoderma reesei RUT C-30]